MITLEQLLEKTTDEELLNIHQEIYSQIVPATSYAHAFCRKVNKMIDSGNMCINPSAYRKVYLPTLTRAIEREMARRYATAISLGKLEVTK